MTCEYRFDTLTKLCSVALHILGHSTKRVGTLPAPLRPIKSSIELENRVAKIRLHAACLQMVHSSFGIVGEGSASGLAMYVLDEVIWGILVCRLKLGRSLSTSEQVKLY